MFTNILNWLIDLLKAIFHRHENNDLAPGLDPNAIPKFVNQLVIPPIYHPNKCKSGTETYHQYNIDISEFTQEILGLNDSNGKPLKTKVWGYGGIVEKHPVTGKKQYFRNSPGATFEAIRGIPIKVKWVNRIKRRHLFPVDPTLHWADPNNMGMPMMPDSGWPSYPPAFPDAQHPVPLVTHLHGGEVPSKYDGNPEAWWTYNGKRGDAYKYGKNQYTYPNEQNQTTLWYHDHALGITRINVLAGLAGFYLLRDRNDSIEAKLPKGKYEVPIVIQDRSFRTDGSFFFDTVGVLPEVHPYWNPEFFGNTIMVNGKVWPNFEAERRQYRFRLLNGSNARFYDLRFENGTPEGKPFIQIGSDGGYLPQPVMLTRLLIAPGERADILVDFSDVHAGTTILLSNSANAPFPDGVEPDENTGKIMQFTVNGQQQNSPPAKLPDILNTIPQFVPVNKTRVLTLTEVMGMSGGVTAPIAVLLNGQRWSANVSEMPQVGTIEEWQIVNLTGDTHPIHLHLFQFQVVGRYQLNAVDSYEKKWLEVNKLGLTDGMLPFKNDWKVVEVPIGDYVENQTEPELNEKGWKDTVKMNPGEVTIIRIRVAPQNADPNEIHPGKNLYSFNPSEPPGYVWHCHILDHEDNEMMRPMKITK